MKRRTFLLGAAAAGAAAAGAGGYWLGSRRRVARSAGTMVIVIGIDGMDPVLSDSMMKEGKLPNLAKLRDAGGFSPLGTSCPPQSPVAWANFINGAGPGSHGIFDFIHRHPEHQCRPFYSAAETVPARGGWEIGEHKIPLDFWPFNHKPAATELKRQGEPFWDFLDAAGVPTTFYDLPSNYPPSPSKHGHHRCICGMGTPDLLGGYGTYQYFAEDVPEQGVEEQGGKRSRLSFSAETAKARIVGPDNGLLKEPRPVTVDFLVHRDRKADAAVIEIQGQRILLEAGQWSRWTKLNFTLDGPVSVLNQSAAGICRFYLQEVAPNFRLYMTPINIDPSAPSVQIAEPPSFIQDVSKKRGLFYTTGFQEDHKARSNGVFTDDEYARQAQKVLDERLALFEYAVDDYDGGLLFFYFSSSDLQSHMFWWNSDDKHPIRSASEAKKYFGHIHRLYQRLDQVVGEVVDRYGSRATIFVMSDHGFANFGRQFNLNSWLREFGYLQPGGNSSIMTMTAEDWSITDAYGLGINGLYLNRKGRERYGKLEPGREAEEKLVEIKERLEAEVDANGERVIRNAYRADKIYSGNATYFAPDLIIGYARGYRASWATCLGDLTRDYLLDNESAWSADHCADALEVPGVLWCNRPFRAANPSLIDIAPSILAEFGRPVPASMSGKSIFS
jgi:predicted AlkP superfamily phosphohydrolase/phosphomutase